MLTTPPAALPESDEAIERFDRLLPPETVRRLSTLRPWIVVAHVLLEWISITAVIWAAYTLFRWNVVAGALSYVAASG